MRFAFFPYVVPTDYSSNNFVALSDILFYLKPYNTKLELQKVIL